MSRNYNILTDILPDSITLYGVEYPIHTSFKNWVRICCILEKESIKEPKVLAEVLKLCYKKTLPPNSISALLGAISFLNRGTDFSVSPQVKREKTTSFSYDAEVIYSSFYSKYGIDLLKTDMHWYKFLALFETLSDENPFKTVIKIRTTDEKGIKDPKIRRKIASLKSKYRIAPQKEVDVGENIKELF